MRAATLSASVGGALLVERLEVRVERGHVVREALREVGERARLVAAPPELAVDVRELLEHLGLVRHVVGELAQRLHRLGQPVLLRLVQRRQQPRAPQPRVPRERPRPERARPRVARVLRQRGIFGDERRRHLQGERARVLRLDERRDERRGDVVQLLGVRGVGGQRDVDRRPRERGVALRGRADDAVDAGSGRRAPAAARPSRAASASPSVSTPGGRPVGIQQADARRRA